MKLISPILIKKCRALRLNEEQIYTYNDFLLRLFLHRLGHYRVILRSCAYSDVANKFLSVYHRAFKIVPDLRDVFAPRGFPWQEIFIRLAPRSIQLRDGSSESACVLIFEKSFYDTCRAGRFWYTCFSNCSTHNCLPTCEKLARR